MTSYEIRRLILDVAHHAKHGHIGSALSVADIIAELYTSVLKDDDMFILSKGHAALAQYCALHLTGKMSKEELYSYCQEGGLDYHPSKDTDGIHFSTGSLGMGLSYAAGVTLVSPNKRVYVLLSDAELQEGSTWESLMFVGNRRLNNLTVLVDYNKSQAMGKTYDIVDVDDVFGGLHQKLLSFGCIARPLYGHSRSEFAKIIQWKDTRPAVLICKTTLGKGVSFMEGDYKWHYHTMSDEEYECAKRSLKP